MPRLFPPGKFVLDPAKVDGADAKVGGDIVLGYALYNMWSFPQKVLITLLRGIPDTGKEFVEVVSLALE